MKLLDKHTASILENHSLMTGEMLFTSLKVINKKPLFFKDHFRRLEKGVEYLFSRSLDYERLLQEVKAQINDSLINYCRITVVREGYFISCKHEAVNSDPLSLGTAFERKADSLKPSYLKLSQYALQFKERRESIYDELLFLGNKDQVFEAVTSNIFMVDEDNLIKTPKLSSNVLDGILRMNILDFLRQKNISFIEAELTRDDLLKAKEVFITNSIRGIRSITNYESTIYKSNLIAQHLKNQFGTYGEIYHE